MTDSPIELDAWTRSLVDDPTYPVLATINPDGSPQLTTMWVGRDGDHLLFSTVEGRQKQRNLARDPRVSVMLVNPENPFQYAEIRGTAEIVPDPGSFIDELSRKYLEKDYPEEPEGTVRLIVRVTPTKVLVKR